MTTLTRIKLEYAIGFILLLALVFLLASCDNAHASITASWYSTQSLKDEGTFKHSKGVMANGRIFVDGAYTCATRLYPLDTMLRITNTLNHKFVVVKVTDRISKRFAQTRIDLSKSAFAQIASLEQGVIPISVEVVS